MLILDFDQQSAVWSSGHTSHLVGESQLLTIWVDFMGTCVEDHFMAVECKRNTARGTGRTAHKRHVVRRIQTISVAVFLVCFRSFLPGYFRRHPSDLWFFPGVFYIKHASVPFVIICVPTLSNIADDNCLDASICCVFLYISTLFAPKNKPRGSLQVLRVQEESIVVHFCIFRLFCTKKKHREGVCMYCIDWEAPICGLFL